MPDFTVPPPPPPPNINSLCYPLLCDNLTHGLPIEEQMKEISKNRQIQEYLAYKNARAVGWEKLRMQFDLSRYNNKQYCRICSESVSKVYPYTRPVYHVHSSSMNRRVYDELDYWGSYECDSCIIPRHSCKIGQRYPLLLTSSTLHGWRGSNKDLYPGDDFHLDTISIPGASLLTLHHAWESEYKNVYRPMDVLVCAGLNDVLCGATVEEFQQRMEHLNSSVKLQNKKHQGFDNSLAFCTLPLPPMCTYLRNDPRTHTRNNLTDVIVRINSVIQIFNAENGTGDIQTSGAPKFHTWGVMQCEDAGDGSLANSIQHRMNLWRESRIEQKLHLNDATRIRMGKSVVKYFKAIYHVTMTDRGQRMPLVPAAVNLAQDQAVESVDRAVRVLETAGVEDSVIQEIDDFLSA